MASLTQYAQAELLDHTLGLGAYTKPAAVYLGLFTASPGETGSLTSEVSGGSYARVELTSKMVATVLGTGLATNSAVVTFPVASASWGAVSYLGIMDAASAGNMLLYFPLGSAVVINASDPALEFVPNTLNISGLFDDPSHITAYLAKKWLDHVLGITTYTAPTTTYLGMFSANPTSAGTLTDEIAVGGYARQAITSLMDATTVSTGVAISNDAIAFPAPTASYSVTYFAVLDALTSGNMLLRYALTATRSVTNGGGAVQLSAGQLSLAAL